MEKKILIKLVVMSFLLMGVVFTLINCSEDTPEDVDDLGYAKTVVFEQDSVLLDINETYEFRAHVYNVAGNEIDLPVYWSVNRTLLDTIKVACINPDQGCSDDNSGVKEGPTWTFKAVGYGLEDIYASVHTNPNASAIRAEGLFLVPKGRAILAPSWDQMNALFFPRNSSDFIYDGKKYSLEINSAPPLVGEQYVYTAYIYTVDGQIINLGAIEPNPVSDKISLVSYLMSGSDTLSFVTDIAGIRLSIEEAENIPSDPANGTGIVLFNVFLPNNAAIQSVRDLLVSDGSAVLMREILDDVYALNDTLLTLKNSGNTNAIIAITEEIKNSVRSDSTQLILTREVLRDVKDDEEFTEEMADYANTGFIQCREALLRVDDIIIKADSIIAAPADTAIISRLDDELLAWGENVIDAFDNAQQILGLQFIYDSNILPPPDVEIIEMTRSQMIYEVQNVNSIVYTDNDNWRYVLWLANNSIQSYLPVPKNTAGTDFELYGGDSDSTIYDDINTRETFYEPGEAGPDYPDQHKSVYITLQPASDLENFTGIVVAKGQVLLENVE